LSLLDLSRWQFAITVMFHMTFPAITVGLSIFLSLLYGMHWKTGKPVYLQMFRFWRRIFAVGFAIGVVAGIVSTFEMGLNWGIYAAKTGPIIGPIVGMEVVTAFFVEAGFIGILLYGDGRVTPATMFDATVMVAIGTQQLPKLEALEGNWNSTNRGYVIFAIPDQQAQRNIADSPTQIRQAIEQLLGDERHRLAASRLGAEIRQQDGASVAADAIAEVLARSKQT